MAGHEVHPVQEVCGKAPMGVTESAICTFDEVHSTEPDDEENELEPRP